MLRRQTRLPKNKEAIENQYEKRLVNGAGLDTDALHIKPMERKVFAEAHSKIRCKTRCEDNGAEVFSIQRVAEYSLNYVQRRLERVPSVK